MVRTTEAPPVPVPTSEADAIVKAQALRAQDYYEDAVRVLKVAEDNFGVSAALRLELAWNLLMIAEEDMTRDLDQDRIDAEVADARVRFDEAVRAEPQIEGRELLEAKMLRYERREAAARKVLEAYVARHPNDAQAHQEMGYFCYVTKDWTGAEREYEELARLAPDDGWAWLYLNIARQWLGHPAEELGQGYVKAAGLLPEVATPLRLIVKLYPDDPDRALALLRQVIAVQPRAVWARIHIAHVLRTRKDPDLEGAESMVRAALAVAPKDQAAHFNLGQLLEQRGDSAAAVAEYVQAAASAPIGDAAETADALDRLLRDEALAASVSAELRLAGWTAIVAKSPSVGLYAHDAARWYADVAHDPQTARRFFDAAAAAEPANDAYREDAAHARSDPAMHR
jgi:Tfp pilus assembly protein PilF